MNMDELCFGLALLSLAGAISWWAVLLKRAFHQMFSDALDGVAEDIGI